jgi:hypothetical protein
LLVADGATVVGEIINIPDKIIRKVLHNVSDVFHIRTKTQAIALLEGINFKGNLLK